MLKKIALTIMTAGFAVAALAQPAPAASTAKAATPATPAAVEQKGEQPKPAKHPRAKKHHKGMEKKVEAGGDAKPEVAAPAKK